LFIFYYFFIFWSSPKDCRFQSFIQNTNLTSPLSLAFHTEITCTAPDISNGYVVEKKQEYQKDAVLNYRCSPGFKPREGVPKCAKFGWTLNPECDGNAPLFLDNKQIIWKIILKSYLYLSLCEKTGSITILD